MYKLEEKKKKNSCREDIVVPYRNVTGDFLDFYALVKCMWILFFKLR